MDDFNFLEEPPPFERDEPNSEPRRKPGNQVVLASDQWAGSSYHSSYHSSNRSSKPPSEPPVVRASAARVRVARAVLLSLAALVAVSVPTWLYIGVRNDLADLRTGLVLARSTIQEVGDLVNDLDRERVKRLAVLSDSIRTVFDFAQGEAQAWHQRFDETDRAMTVRLDGLARVDRDQRSRMDALDRQNRTYSSAFAAMSRRAQTQESTTSDITASVSSLRTALSRLDGELLRLDGELGALEDRYAASTTAYGQLGRRVESFSTWADGFRQAGLSGEAVRGRFSALNAELRRIRMQVDSLRPPSRAMTTSDNR